MKTKLAMIIFILLMVGFAGYGCDTDTTGGCGRDTSSGVMEGSIEGVCIETGVTVSGASEARLYYPCDIAAPAGATTITGGLTETLHDCEWLSERTADAGYVVLGMTPTNNVGMSSAWRDMQKNGVAKLKQINTSHSVLQGMIDTAKLQISGHSKGGGGTLWASGQLGNEVKSTIVYAPFKIGFADTVLADITSQTMIQAGSADTLALYNMTHGEYEALTDATISKAYFEYEGFGHMAWTTDNIPEQQDLIAEDAIAWMKYYLDCDTSAAATLHDTTGNTKHEWVDKGPVCD